MIDKSKHAREALKLTEVQERTKQEEFKAKTAQNEVSSFDLSILYAFYSDSLVYFKFYVYGLGL